MTAKLDRLLDQLKIAPDSEGVFNPWYQRDEEHEYTEQAPAIRRRHLQSYLADRLGRARFLLIGEALGYQGGHFSGLAMTSERILLGHKTEDGIPPSAVLPADIEPARTSNPELKPAGFSEPTATIVWGALLASGVDPRDFVLWNAFAWHPFDPEGGMLTNRRPLADELSSGADALSAFLDLFPAAQVLAVGAVAHQVLADQEVKAPRMRHPAHGGAPKFRRQWSKVLAGESF